MYCNYLRIRLFSQTIIFLVVLFFPLLSYAALASNPNPTPTTSTTTTTQVNTTKTLTTTGNTPPYENINTQAVTSTVLPTAPNTAKNVKTDNKLSPQPLTQQGNTEPEGSAQPVPQTPADIAEIMIETSAEIYKDRCVCPHTADQDGYECGVESLYYKPGAHRFYCYPRDIRGQQYIFYRKNSN